MSTSKALNSDLKNYSGLARLELFEFVVATFPLIFVMPFRGYSVYGWRGVYIALIEYTKISILISIAFLIASSIVSFIFDKYRAWKIGIKAEAIPLEYEVSILDVIRKTRGFPARRMPARLRWNPKDFSMGAHVKGFFFPTIVISGGLGVGLRSGNTRALAILAHEIAHIQHYDRLLPGFFGFAVFEIVMYPVLLLSSGIQEGAPLLSLTSIATLVFLYKITGLGAVLVLLYHSREYYADACASQISQSRDEYNSILSNLCKDTRGAFSIFHPSLNKRINAVATDFPSLMTRWLWRGYFLYLAAINAVVFFGNWESVTEDQLMFSYCGMWASVAVLFIEFLRVPILRSSISFRFWTPSRKFVRFSVPPISVALAAISQVVKENILISSVIIVAGHYIFSNMKEWSEK